MQRTVSVIIPVYNVERFLNTCVESIVSQTYEDLQILLIDDGSTDNSGKICDEWGTKDKRITVIHKVNGGLSDARNCGIENAKGDYIFFVDSDDFISKDFIERLIFLLEDKNADISIAPLCHTKETTNNPVLFDSERVIKTYNSKAAITASLYQVDFSCNAPSKLFKKELFADIRFPVGRVSEDLAIAQKLFMAADKIVSTNEWGYFYRQREKSILHSFNTKRLDALHWLDEIMDEFGNDREIRKAVRTRMINIATHLLLDIPDKKDYPEEYRIIWSYIKRNRMATMFNNKARLVDRGSTFLSVFGDGLLRKIWNSSLSVKRREY